MESVLMFEAPASTADKTSFAYISARDRWPIILVRNENPFSNPVLTIQTGAIDDVHRAVSETDDEVKRTEGKRIIEELAKLKYELQHDRQLTYVWTFAVPTHRLTVIDLSLMMDKEISPNTTRSWSNSATHHGLTSHGCTPNAISTGKLVSQIVGL
jgi:hypothetical protein